MRWKAAVAALIASSPDYLERFQLIVLTPERFTVANPEHVALARRVRELLERAGLLTRVTH